VIVRTRACSLYGKRPSVLICCFLACCTFKLLIKSVCFVDAAVPPYTCTCNSCLSALHCVDMDFDSHVADGTDLEFWRHLVGKLMNSAL
jgi:hypothetical protein